MIKVLELFSGYGGCSFALTKAGIEHKTIGYSDIEKCANYIYDLNHGGKALGDITKIDENELEDFDLLTGGFPCSPAGTKIKTINGYKNIEDVKKNEMVLTHNNNYKKVLKTMNRISNHYNIIKAVGVYNLKLTDEHPVYIYRDNSFQWCNVSELNKGDYLTFNINDESKNVWNLIEKELWLLGRYCADGSIEKKRNRLYFAIGSHKRMEFENYINNLDYYVCHEDRNCQEFYIKNNRLIKLCKNFNNGSKNKFIPQEIIDLPINLLKIFLDGYIAGDGFIETNKRERKMFATVSELMLLGLQDCFIKTEHRIPSVSVRVDNRKESFNNSFNAQICKNNRDTFVVDNKILSKVKSISKINKNIKVYNFEVEKDNSYTCNNVVVHNCQSFSIAGKREGFAAANKGKLFFDIIRIAEAKKPRRMLLENVQGLLSHDDGKTMEIILHELKRIGYYVHWKLMKSKDHGTPQNRPRVWIACFREEEDYRHFSFPEKEELKITVKDLLEDDVDEKYFLSEKQLEKFNNHNRYGDHKLEYGDKIHPTLCSIEQSDVAIIPEDFKIADFRYDEGIQPRKDGIYPTLASGNTGNGLSGQPMIMSLQPRSIERPSMQKAIKEGKSLPGGYGTLQRDDGVAYTLDTSAGQAVQQKKWRRLTPRECFRLMGFFNDEIKFGNLKDSKLYFLAGNGWDINTASKIFKQMFIGNTNSQRGVFEYD